MRSNISQPSRSMALDADKPYTDRMKLGVTTIERAFQLADSGRFSSTEEIRKTLGAEGYNRQQLMGRSLMKQLRVKIEAARGPTPKRPKTCADPRGR